ncbi:MAG TPA: hypothetical protein VKB46_22655, partial [Pyrinomonadaceae bacterium]|nr:hypothetical protein [Pyrinomonadaceae bacterium]
MKSTTLFAPTVTFVLLSVFNQAQAQDSSSLVRPRTVTGASQSAQATNTTPTQAQQAPPKPSLPAAATVPVETKLVVAEEPENQTVAKPATLFLTPPVIQSRITEAERLLKSRPLTTASSPSIEFVTIAALDVAASRTHLVTLSKETFLTKGAELTLPSSLGV